MVIYQCDYCNIKTTNKFNYDNHIKTVKHQKNAKFFIENDNLDDNLDDNSNDNFLILSSKKYECIFCKKRFTQASNLSRHKKSCSKKQKKGLYCMWNEKMIINNKIYFKIGRISKKDIDLTDLVTEYNIQVSDIQLLYYVEIKNELLAEIILQYLLEKNSYNTIKKYYSVSLDLIKNYIGRLKKILSKCSEDQENYIIKNFKKVIDCRRQDIPAKIYGIVSKIRDLYEENDTYLVKKENLLDIYEKSTDPYLDKIIIEDSIDKKKETFLENILKEQNRKMEERQEKIDKIMELMRDNKEVVNNVTYYESVNQNNLLYNLNLNFSNVISMEQFLHNMEHINKISRSDLEAIAYASENMTEGDLAETIHKTLEKNCVEQTKGKICPTDGKELLPVMPVVCSDGNCRSHKEKVNNFWETVYEDKHFDLMLNIIDKRLFEVLKKKIYLEEHGKKKLFKKIKKKNTIHDMKKFQEKINGTINASEII